MEGGMDPEHLLGSLIFGGLGRRLPGGAKAAIGMGLLGVAIAAIEQFSQQGHARAMPPPPPQPPRAGAPPPPPPPPATAPPATTTGAAPADPAAHGGDAMLLVRAMIAAAHADGRLDDDERRRILEEAQRVGLSAHDSEIVAGEMDRPLPVDELAAQVTSREQAEQVYAAALLALHVETDAEHAFLAALAARLALPADAVARIHALLGE
jgi:uncharacterized membrane protein YebE (DUF533 family)